MLTISPLQNAGIFLTNAFFSAYLTVVLLRFIFQLVRADFYNPLAQFIVRVTNPVLIPLRKIIPGFMGLDLASILLLFTAQVMKLLLLLIIKGGTISIQPLFLLGLTCLATGELLDLTVSIYLYAIIIFAILSWIPQHNYNPLIALIMQIINPLLRPISKYIKPIAGLDLSPWFLILILQLTIFLVVHPLLMYGTKLILTR